MYILGINCFHADSSACIIKDGILLAAVEEERFKRIKHWSGFPRESIKFCLNTAGIKLQDIQHVAINQNSRANLFRKILAGLELLPSYSLIGSALKNRNRRANVSHQLSELFDTPFTGEIHAVEHHLAHMASAYYVSPFNESAILSVDGFGDFASTTLGYGEGNRINSLEKIYFPHSLGIFYQAMTQWLGFSNYGDEYKVMGLAPYGDPNYVDKLSQLLKLHGSGKFTLDLKFFRHAKERAFQHLNSGIPSINTLYTSVLEEVLGPARLGGEEITSYHFDIARSTQELYEQALFEILNHLYQKVEVPNLCLAGGCAMNSVANGKIYLNTPFEKIYVQAAAGDAGGALGAALQVWNDLGGSRSFVMHHAYWGPSYDEEFISHEIERYRDRLNSEGCEYTYIASDTELQEMVAKLIADGLVVGWFQGRAEWGPRALGNRSILGDPRRSDMKNILNLKIKRRESFRPFAPSILRESVSEWFELLDDVPFMMQVYPIKTDKRPLVPAVTHVDGSGRLQSVSKDANPRYYGLIKSFQSLTGVPMLLNTSFNENEPIVCQPSEAIECFLRTKMDILVLENWVFLRKTQ